MSFIDDVNAALHAVPLRQELAHEFLSSSCAVRRFLIGRNEESLAVLNIIKPDGIIDDFAEDLSSWHGVPVIRLQDVPAAAIVLNCSTSISPVTVLETLNNAGIAKVLNFCDLVPIAGRGLSWPWFVSQQRDDWVTHEVEWAQLFGMMADEESRQTLLDVVRYRLTAEPAFMRNYTVRLRDQYFENFMQLKNETFVDAGGFDGDTSEEFCSRYPDYHAIHLFEPSPSNISAARMRLRASKRINFFQLGLSDSQGFLHFDSEAGSASSVSDAGGTTIKVVKLDDVITGAVSFIKMDLEGWEMKALAGCTQHICSDYPKLAISVYHSAEDFRKVPAYLRSLQSQYRIYLRHYTQGWSETVMYFMPT
ncbi:FkbM family methyltransferase [Ferribacterium limneticum]|uniref:FkbM family methyltransferase n=1 Tax=Ferribacterium limneticum TaxID=76259 RepID=UPI001CF83069|nr:FkbM family methyltransferase [Ferribacterium limneticum]UCV24217.1 FkbM family methyltransferase [Ferribacterium limneticum]